MCFSSPFALLARQPHPSRLDNDNYNYTPRRVQILQLLVMQFPPPSSHFIPLWSKYFPQHFVLNTLSLYSSLNVRDQVSHPYRNMGKIIVFYILIFKLFDS
jgi:hypothetical protein